MSISTKSAATMSTSELWVATHRALSNARWPEARALLDALGQRDDNRDLLPAYSAYDQGDAGERTQFAQLLRDRINLVNSKAQR